MNKAFSNKRSIVLFMTPAALVFLAVMIIPIFATGYYSTLEWDGIGDATFVGIKNYISLLLDNKYEFWQSVGHSFIVLFLSVFVQETIAMVLALILAKGVKGESFFRTAFFIPMVVSTVVIAQLFLKIYNPNYGLLNTMLESLGLGRWANEWLGDPKIAIWAVFIPLIWQYIGYHMLLFYGAIKSLSTDILEAARIDGANLFPDQYQDYPSADRTDDRDLCCAGCGGKPENLRFCLCDDQWRASGRYRSSQHNYV